MITLYSVIRANGEETQHSADLAAEPDYYALRALVQPLLGTSRDMEHVSVLHEGEHRDMFVDEDGHGHDLPRNDKATAIYRHNWLTQRPGTEPEDLPWIVGTAVLFSRRVWF